jgi:hypothetical protein
MGDKPEMKLHPSFLLLPLVAGCTAVPSASPPQPGAPPVVRPPTAGVPPTRPMQPPQVGFRAPQILRAPGLEGVIEQNFAGLVRQFGSPRLEVAEGDMRKVQFSGQGCVLDVFLYPLREGGEPVATYVDARRPSDGQDVDRAACVRSLRRR